MAFRIQFKPAAQKEFDALDGSIRQRVAPVIDLAHRREAYR